MVRKRLLIILTFLVVIFTSFILAFVMKNNSKNIHNGTLVQEDGIETVI